MSSGFLRKYDQQPVCITRSPPTKTDDLMAQRLAHPELSTASTDELADITLIKILGSQSHASAVQDAIQTALERRSLCNIAIDQVVTSACCLNAFRCHNRLP